MSESPEDRTKRVFISALLSTNPCYQVSLVFNPDDYLEYEAKELLEQLPRFKKRLADLFDYPILSWMQYKKIDNKYLPVMVMFFAERPSDHELRKINSSVDRIFIECPSMNVINRKYSIDKLSSRINTLKRHKLNDLSKVFGGHNINRFTVINKSKMNQI
jgi:hypothetical protein